MKRTPAGLLLEGADHLGLVLYPEQVDRLMAFDDLLRRRALPIGLVSKADGDRLVQRHLLDSLQAAALLRSTDHEAADLGSGAGLPGIPVAIAVPEVRVHLIESTRRRVAFLELALAELGVPNASVIAARVEDAHVTVDAVLARALAPLERCWDLARALLRPGGRLLYFSGPRQSVPERLPGASGAELSDKKFIDSPGPIVIITRQ